MLVAKVGKAAPEFALVCVGAMDTDSRPIRLSDYSGRWLAIIFYPRDFTLICPTELTSFSARFEDFRKRDCELLGISADSIELHQEWLATPPEKGGLGPLQFPLAADPDGAAACAFGVWVDEKQVATRGLFIIDPDGILQYTVVHNLRVGRSADEVLRVLDALRTGELCPASWTSADGTIDPERALQPGRILGHYRIHRHLGSGTFGAVFAAWDLRLERMVALKVLKRSIFESREAVLSEARAAAKLSHPNVCTVYAVEEEDGLPIMAMEYLAGQPLSQTIAEGLQRGSARKLAAQIVSGLAAGHEQNVVHGDLKPDNVMVTRNGEVKILDFGLARSQMPAPSATARVGDEQPRNAMPQDSQLVPSSAATVEFASSASSVATDVASEAAVIRGTPLYMSPEQAMGLPVTLSSDVFSFGLLLFEILTGRPGRTEQSLVKLLFELPTQDLAPQLAQQVDETYRELLMAMLAREPASRPSMSEVMQKLASIHVSQAPAQK